MLVNEKNEKRDPRIRRTDKLLKETLQELLAERAFQTITVQDIVDRAEINRGTFYAHFELKSVLLNYSVRTTLDERLESKSQNTQSFSLINLRALAASVLEFGTNEHCHPSNRNLGPVLIAPRVQQFIYETLLEWISKAQSEAAIHSASPEQTALALSWVIAGGRFRWLGSTRKPALEQFVDEMMALLMPIIQAYFAEGIYFAQ